RTISFTTCNHHPSVSDSQTSAPWARRIRGPSAVSTTNFDSVEKSEFGRGTVHHVSPTKTSKLVAFDAPMRRVTTTARPALAPTAMGHCTRLVRFVPYASTGSHPESVRCQRPSPPAANPTPLSPIHTLYRYHDPHPSCSHRVPCPLAMHECVS